MNTTFLEVVAQDILRKHGYDLSRIAIVFPNKRASLFMNDHLARLAGRPIWSPAYITISDLFRRHSTLVVADPIKQVCDLHRIFVQTTGMSETLDHFYGWGQLLLSDFDDIDKNMADADKVFANLRDLHELDDLSYLTEEQKALLKKFFSNFADDQESELKRRFLSLWSRFSDIYHAYNQHLAAQGLAYEGALYRQVAENEAIPFEYEKYIFVGFNLLQQVEQTLFRRLAKEGRAFFYWDFDHYYIDNLNNEAGHYIRSYLQLFPNELDNRSDEIYNNLDKSKRITYISAPTENVQARYVSRWLSEEGRMQAGRETAIVLCNEGLLETVIHSLPPEVGKTNITTGYPLSQTPFASLLSLLITLQTEGRVKDTDKFRLKHVLRILRHPYAKFISDETINIVRQLNEHKQFYPSRQTLAIDDGLEILFQNPASLTSYLLQVLRHIGTRSHDEEDPLYQESLFRTYTLVNRLHTLVESGDLMVDLATFQRLLAQLVKSTTIPFHGEPAEGVQVMGVLETRNLDFRHVILLSCNEGNMPRGVNDSSFIPYSVRKAHGLTTIDNKVSVYAYYFHRLLQRADDVTLLYNHATAEGQTGEMSRFMMQLMVEGSNPVTKAVVQTGQALPSQLRLPIEKDAAVMQQLGAIKSLSPTAINRFLRCPKQFYYNILAELKEPDNTDEDEVDNRIFGNIFHRSAELIYSKLMEKSNEIQREDILNLLKQPQQLAQVVDQAFREELFKVEHAGFTPDYNGLQLINREVIINYLRQLLRVDVRHTPFTILGMEKRVQTSLSSIIIGGIIDRIDLVRDPHGRPLLRVIDYKTGRQASMSVNDIADLFTGMDIGKKHSDYFLQTILYSYIVRHSRKYNPNDTPVAPALLFIQHAGAENYDPVLSLGSGKSQSPIADVQDVEQEFIEHLSQLLADLFNPAVPFRPAADETLCEHCPYSRLCLCTKGVKINE
ncbi:MAG: PD-(D/E)XK nuclease family protein [Prevotella sp.]|nr:PD-(D/E)XK nuclease family protein [Prevotella sp.]